MPEITLFQQYSRTAGSHCEVLNRERRISSHSAQDKTVQKLFHFVTGTKNNAYILPASRLLLVGRVYCFSCLVCIFLSYVYLLYIFIYFRRRTAGYKSVFGRSCDRPPRQRFFLVYLCLKANAEMVPKTPSCHYMLLM